MDSIIGQTTIIMIVVSVIKTEKVDLKFYFRTRRQSACQEVWILCPDGFSLFV